MRFTPRHRKDWHPLLFRWRQWLAALLCLTGAAALTAMSIHWFNDPDAQTIDRPGSRDFELLDVYIWAGGAAVVALALVVAALVLVARR